MRCHRLHRATLATLLALAASAAPARAEDRDILPDHRDLAADRATTWAPDDSALISPVQWPEVGGTRVSAFVAVSDDGAAPRLEARGLSADAIGPWIALEETFRGDEHRVAVIDLGQHWSGAQLRLAAADHGRVGDLAWELTVPRFPDAGFLARSAATDNPDVVQAVASQLDTIGVVSRESWGARPTQCSAVENDWYRMAIHHTAGSQLSGGTVAGAVRALQAYSQDSGTYCDIPYQFLIGFDGTLWEGRSLTYTSGATGGGNNDGNIALSFLGCYHSNSCPGGVSHAATDEMMAAARLLTQTLVRLHAIPSDANSIRAHSDWPNNSTVCPGDYIYPRLDELRTDLAWYAAVETGRSFPGPGDEPLTAEVGEAVDIWVELRNTGGLPWLPGKTFLGTTDARDSDSSLYHDSWLSTSRAATVAASVAPGEIGRFQFSVRVGAEGDWQQSFGLVQEWVTWFGDAPWGGGPGDDAVVVRVSVSAVDAEPDPDPDPDPDDPDDPDPDDPDDPDDPGSADVPVPGDGDEVTTPMVGGCGISGGEPSSGGGSLLLLVCAGLCACRRRRPR